MTWFYPEGKQTKMIAFRITDTKDFMTKLLAGDTFDTFLFSEGTVTTFTTFAIDGTWHPEYFGEDDGHAMTWKLMRPYLYGIIKGHHTPLQMRIVLKLADYNVEHLLKQAMLPLTKEQVGGLFLNLTYTREEVSVTTGTSLKIFTLDRSIDKVWDDMVRRFFESRKILVNEA
jgi:hypothetical protein